jgi:hypothetical protein
MKSCVDKLSKFRSRGAKNKSGNMAHVEYYHCHNFGHIAKHCPNQNKTKPTNTGRNSQQTNTPTNQENQ